MSLNRRRWSNKFVESMREFQSREELESIESLEVTESEISLKLSDETQYTNATSNFSTAFSLKNNSVSSKSQDLSEEVYKSTFASSASSNVLDKSKSLNVLNFSITETDNFLGITTTTNILNENISFKEPNLMDNRSNDLIYLNKSITEIASLDNKFNETSPYNCNSQTQNIIEIQSSDNQSIQCLRKNMEQLLQPNHSLGLNEDIIENITINSSNDTITLSSWNLNLQNSKTESMEDQSNVDLKKIPNEDYFDERYCSSPLELLKSNEESINKMQHPDVWDELMALEEALSPLEEREGTIKEHPHDYPHLLRRLSQKFKETPTKFTEKLVSIIEDSIVSLESPTKKNVGDISGISLHRMTGEFRKLCKFIEDESMPEWAPSLVNMTTSHFNKTETPDNEKNNQNSDKEILKNINNTPSQKIATKLLKNYATPKSKKETNADTPIKNFTPSADKSFEYWEKICNMMCDNQPNGKKKLRNSISVPESTKRSMNEMLTICERQMASLDDSNIHIDIRNSEPCKKTISDLEVTQTPRSKSESKIFVNVSPEKSQSPTIDKEKFVITASKTYSEEKIDKKLDFCNENLFKKNKLQDDNLFINKSQEFEDNIKSLASSPNKSQAFEDNIKSLAGSPNKSQEFEDNIKSLASSPNKSQEFGDNIKSLTSSQTELEKFLSNETSFNNDNDQNCSLLVELAKRRQRCLDTAKLMMEIDKEDPITTSDKKCLETLYKLGVQDQTFIENDDAKFLNTLGQCLEYKKYCSSKSKRLINTLQNLNSPDKLESKTSIMKSKKSQNLLKPLNTLNSVKKKMLYLEPKNYLKNVHDNNKMQTPRLSTKTVSKVSQQSSVKAKETSRIEKKSLHLPNSQQVKMTPRSITKHNSQIGQVKRNLQQQTQQKKVSSATSISKPLSKLSRSEVKASVAQSVKKLTPKVSPEVLMPGTTQQSNEKEIVLKMLEQHSIRKKIVFSPENHADSNVSNDNNDGKNDDTTVDIACTPEQHKTETTPERPKKTRLFVTPGKSPTTCTFGRKKPTTYFSDLVSKKTPSLKINYNSVKSPINMYIHGTDNDLIQNVKGRTEDFLLTPVLNQKIGASPKLKLKLASKENKSPFTNCDENTLSTVRYQSADKIRLIDDKSSYSPSSLTPNSRTKKLLEPIENTVVIRHEGRIIEYNPKSDHLDSETSIRVQKMAEKMSTMQKKYI